MKDNLKVSNILGMLDAAADFKDGRFAPKHSSPGYVETYTEAWDHLWYRQALNQPDHGGES